MAFAGEVITSFLNRELRNYETNRPDLFKSADLGNDFFSGDRLFLV